MENLRSKVRSIWPHDGSELLVDDNLGEERLISQRFENRPYITLQFRCQVDIAYKAVGKRKPKTVAAEIGDTRDVVFRRHGSGSILAKGSSAWERSQSAASSSVKPDPLLHQPEGPARQSSIQDFATGDQYLGFIFAITSMKMRRHMVLVVHGDDNSVEGRFGAWTRR